MQLESTTEGNFIRTKLTYIWEALDLERQPIRVAYFTSRRILHVVEYRNIEEGPVDPALFQVPEGYLSFTPF